MPRSAAICRNLQNPKAFSQPDTYKGTFWQAGATPDPHELARFCAETLAAYKVPSQWELRTEPLPRNPSGKILKNVLSGQAASAFVED